MLMTDPTGTSIGWESPTQSPDDQTVNVTELVLLWLRIAALEALDITARLPVRPDALNALEDYLLYLPEVPMTTVLLSTLKRMPCSTAIVKTYTMLHSMLRGSRVILARNLSRVPVLRL